jgi:cell division transport system permease protein
MSRNRPKTSRTEALPAPANIRVARNRGLERTSFAQWKTQHRFAARAALTQLATHRIGSIVNVFVIGLALALPLLLDFAVRNLASVGGALGEQREIAVFLNPELDRAGVDQAMRGIRAVTGVDVVTRRTPEQGIEELRQLPGFDACGSRAGTQSTCPGSHLVTPDPTVTSQASLQPRNRTVVAGVDLVQHDAAWRARLDSHPVSCCGGSCYVLAGLARRSARPC